LKGDQKNHALQLSDNQLVMKGKVKDALLRCKRAPFEV